MENVTENSNDFRTKLETLHVSLAIPLLIMASIGNSLSFVIMRRTSMKNTSAGVYFSAIACLDTMTVYCSVLPFTIYYFNSVDLQTLHPWSCKIIEFMLLICSDIAIWLLVAVTVDRFIAVKYPMKKSQMCTRKRAVIVACILPFISFLKNVHFVLHKRETGDRKSRIARREMDCQKLWISNSSLSIL